ncbi:MAG: hypothetical protein QN183_10135 [Armatimonadota bacterium]|nr:hypothetical protein [Armatimonadota bacterium]MDR7485826.1 hypothetical protein [Armatimonadota bacterium]MDR7532123.1 hypothetical protein [Armatimonadota bacterium]MDR7536712.1 hypothetical protein [Armatimonadota bacterium]
MQDETRLRALEARIDALERRLSLGGLSVEAALRRRGWRVSAACATAHVLLPRGADAGQLDRFYQDLHRYHFRRLLQEVAELGGVSGEEVARLEARWGAQTVHRTFARLAAYGLLERRGQQFALTVALRTFGGTLEWFVAQVLQRDFLAPAAWDVRIREIRGGGDFDVLAVLDGRLAYMECKGSPPYNVPADALAEFVGRIRRLGPDLAALVLDTTLQIDRNIIANLRPLLASAPGAAPEIARVAAGLYEVRGGAPLFVITSRRSLVANLGRCLRRFHALTTLSREGGGFR